MKHNLEKEIIENPTDLGLRMVYADYLEEYGDFARSEFIRIQIELENAVRGRAADLKQKEKKLLSEWGKIWGAFYSVCGLKYKFYRGFIEYLQVYLLNGNFEQKEKCASYLESLLSLAPIRGLTLNICGQIEDLDEIEIKKITKIPSWKKVTELAIVSINNDLDLDEIYWLGKGKEKLLVQYLSREIGNKGVTKLINKLKEKGPIESLGLEKIDGRRFSGLIMKNELDPLDTDNWIPLE